MASRRYENFDLSGAYAISLVLATIAVLVLLGMTLIKPRELKTTAMKTTEEGA